MARLFKRSGGADRPSKGAEKKPRFQQLRQVYGLARSADPYIAWWMAAAVVGATVLGALIGGAFGHPIYGGFLGFLVGLPIAMFVLSRKAERSAYDQIEGRPGAGGAVLQSLRRGWAYEQEPVAMEGGRSQNIEHTALVYRAVGRAGVVLIGEGPTGRTNKLLGTERKKAQRLVPNVPVTTYRLGTGEGENVVSTRELVGRMKKLGRRRDLTKSEVTAVNKRLHALGRMAPPIPKGIDPQRARQMGRGQRM